MPSFLAGLNAFISYGTTVSFQSVQPPPVDNTQQLPICVIQMITGAELENLEGLSELTDTIMQMSVVSKLYDTAFGLRGQLVTYLSQASGAIPGISGISIAKATDFRYRDLFMPETELWHLILRCHIWWMPS